MNLKTDLPKQILAGDRRAIASALNLIDDQRPKQKLEAERLLSALSGIESKPRIGITGPPGAGKSTIINALALNLAEQGLTTGIIAVDPSSRQTGGALLGDRIRMREHSDSEQPFLRSMAARDRLGGISSATHAGAAILEAAFDLVIIETVGIGQSEDEVRTLVDTLVYVCQPGAGDLIQFMKAGILELPDIFVINKCDLGNSVDRSLDELRSALGLTTKTDDDWKPPVLLTSGENLTGISELCDQLTEHKHFLQGGIGLQRRREGRDQFIRKEFLLRYGSLGLEALGGDRVLGELCSKWHSPSPYEPLMHLDKEVRGLLQGLLNRPNEP